MKLAEVLSGPETWCRGWWHKNTGERCLLGALTAMLKAECDHMGHYIHESNRLARMAGTKPGLDLINWNNAEERTWDEVALVVDAYDRDRMLHP